MKHVMITKGATVHILRGSKYAGPWTISEAGDPDGDGWREISDGHRRWFARDVDAFTTEAEARAEARNRRQPRRTRQPQPLYGDFAVIAMLNGIRTDGTGRLV